ncbi:MAG: Gfo/Idh/MocA family protein [Longibaculum sp.]
MIRWGIIGLGNIAMRFYNSLMHCENGYLYAVASRTPLKRESFHQQYPHVKVYDNYEDLLNDEQIDVVYIALRHADHYALSKAALLHQKAVLCEKPATLSYQQTQELCDLSFQNNLFFMEAMKTRFIPLIADIKEELEKGSIGDIEYIETAFCSCVPYREGHYLFDKGQGGALYDVGIYNIASVLDYIHSPLVHVKTKWKENYGVDVHDNIELTFENGQKAFIELAIDEKKEKIMTIKGTKGKLIAEPFYRPTVATLIQDGQERILQKPYIRDDFYTEIEEVHRCLQAHLIESPRMTHQDSLDCMAVIEAIKESFYD